MRFLHIDPAAHKLTAIDAASVHEAHPKLQIGNIDHGTVHRARDGSGVGIIVYQYGLLQGDGPYFALDGQLYAGDAILFAFDAIGETIDMPPRVPISMPIWLDTREDVELAIAAGRVERPQSAVNGEVVWQWGGSQ